MFRTKSQFEKVFDKATSNLLLEPDLDSMLQMCDMIRGGDVKPRDACSLIKTRVIEEKNPHVQLFCITVLDIVMKNCGEPVHKEIITESFLESLKGLVQSTSSEDIKAQLLDMIQAWGVGFKENSSFKIAPNLYNIMKVEGYKFPAVTDMTDTFKSEKAPTWSEGDECSNCQSEFSLLQRKHHCRACGGIFCNKCSNKQAIIPQFGIEKEVRVCDKCYSKLSKKPSSSTGGKDGDLPSEYLNSSLFKESQEPPKKDDLALKEEEELQLALALSLDEQENKQKIQKETPVNGNATYATVNKSPAPTNHSVDPETDPDLARYLNRSYWDSKKSEQENERTSKASTSPSTNVKTIAERNSEPIAEIAPAKVNKPMKVEEPLLNGGVAMNAELINNLRTSVEIFVNRMRSDEIRGRSIVNDSTVQSLFQSINNMHPTLIQYMNELEEKRLHEEGLQDKLVQIRDARAALDALRSEHADKMRRAAEEANRQRQIQMAQKLEVMRQKKQEYLAYQRQMALQRMQEQEAARQARLQQQKQFIQQKAMQPSMLVAGYNMQMPPPNVDPAVNDRPPQSGYYGNYSAPQQAYIPPNMQYSGVPTNNMYAQPGQPFNDHGYQQQQPGPAPGPMQHAPTGIDHYNMNEMASSLPSQQSSLSSIPQQLVASAPPATPQPTLNSQQVDPNMGYQPPPQQGYYQQPHPSQAPPNPPQQQQDSQDSGAQNPGLLISFD